MPARFLFSMPALMLAAALFYQAALHSGPAAPWLAALSAAALCALTKAKTARRAFYGGTGAALLTFCVPLWFFTGIFGLPMAFALWMCLAVWTGMFCGTLHVLRRKWGAAAALAAAPVLWMGLEYCRSELWLLRFAWLTPGYALPAEHMGWLFQTLGVYGSGALLVLAGAAVAMLPKTAWRVAAGLAVPALLLPGARVSPPSGQSLRITGIQLEQVWQETILEKLDAALTRYPDTQLFVLPEYTFPTTVTAPFTEWCRRHGRWLIAGGFDFAPGLYVKRKDRTVRGYYNTAWVIGPEGTVVHRQAKAMPIQFFDDGMPAAIQRVWESPWGRIGICICYDMNYAMVGDPLAAQDMQLLVVPTMDAIHWGEAQHRLSAKLASTRAVEYGVPVVRVASSGVSLMLDAAGRTLAEGSVPGRGEIVSAVISLSGHARRPWDRHAAAACSWAAGLLVTLALALSFVDERRRKREARNAKAAAPPDCPPSPPAKSALLPARLPDNSPP
ncbi:MAG: hypothetical protein EOP86_08325 [Verrucomicrobiaceae bacterium]|nr:MAG: hypothetical protein EOP86_08325 [Verrucomicrobiaceae bacterium]